MQNIFPFIEFLKVATYICKLYTYLYKSNFSVISSASTVIYTKAAITYFMYDLLGNVSYKPCTRMASRCLSTLKLGICSLYYLENKYTWFQPKSTATDLMGKSTTFVEALLIAFTKALWSLLLYYFSIFSKIEN